MALLEVKNLKKYFYGPKGAVHAVDDVTMSIDAGQTMGVVGESGCGKSTLAEPLSTCKRQPTARSCLMGETLRIPPKRS